MLTECGETNECLLDHPCGSLWAAWQQACWAWWLPRPLQGLQALVVLGSWCSQHWYVTPLSSWHPNSDQFSFTCKALLTRRGQVRMLFWSTTREVCRHAKPTHACPRDANPAADPSACRFLPAVGPEPSTQLDDSQGSISLCQ